MIAGLSTGEPPGKDWTIEGNAVLVQGNYSGAIFYFDKAIQENPQYTLAWCDKGGALYAGQLQ